jgi:hypothetical protein
VHIADGHRTQRLSYHSVDNIATALGIVPSRELPHNINRLYHIDIATLSTAKRADSTGAETIVRPQRRERNRLRYGADQQIVGEA